VTPTPHYSIRLNQQPKKGHPLPTPSTKFETILELVELGERAFVYKLKKMNPLISTTEIEEAVRGWYQDRPGAEMGDGVGIIGDIERFKSCKNSSK
jgi:hypothetical protein